LDNLAKKTGSTSSNKEFKRMITKVITDNLRDDYIPEYTFSLAGDLLTVRPRKAQQAVAVPLPSLKPDTITEAKHHAAGWDIYVLQDEWRDWVADKKIKVADADAHFIKFCRKRGPYKQEELF
jgi:hypothetical protein